WPGSVPYGVVRSRTCCMADWPAALSRHFASDAFCFCAWMYSGWFGLRSKLMTNFHDGSVTQSNRTVNDRVLAADRDAVLRGELTHLFDRNAPMCAAWYLETLEVAGLAISDHRLLAQPKRLRNFAGGQIGHDFSFAHGVIEIIRGIDPSSPVCRSTR